MKAQEELYQALESGDASLANRALKAGADPNCDHPENGTPLSFAVMYGHADVVRLLLAAGATLDSGTHDGCDALYWAVKHKSVVNVLLEAGLRVGVQAEGETALHQAVLRDDLEFLNLLLHHGGRDVLESFDEFDRTPLHWAVAEGTVEVVRFLLEAGSDPDALSHVTKLDTVGDPPLRAAVERGDLDIIELLLEYEADPDRPGWMWNTARDDARRLGLKCFDLAPLVRPGETEHRAELERQLLADAHHYGVAAESVGWDAACPRRDEALQVRGRVIEPCEGVELLPSRVRGTFAVLALTVEKSFLAYWTELVSPDGSVVTQQRAAPPHLLDRLTDDQKSWLRMDGRNRREQLPC